MFMNTNYSS